MLIVRRRRRTETDQNGDTSVPRAFRMWLIATLAILVFGVVVISRIAPGGAGSDTSGPLPILKTIPSFALTERDGRTVTTDDLRGSIWVADFFFTSCAGPCPALSLRMRSIQQSVRSFDGDVKLVSFSVDPEFDTPAVMTRYAERYEADPKLWWFLTTNDKPAMHRLVKEGFLQAVSPGAGGNPIIHTTQILLVDREGRIRAWHDGLEPSCQRLVLRDLKKLLAEPAP